MVNHRNFKLMGRQRISKKIYTHEQKKIFLLLSVLVKGMRKLFFKQYA